MNAERIPVLYGQTVRLRPATGDDAPRFLEILSQPEVARWWGDFDLERVHSGVIGYEGDFPLAVEAEGEVIGLILFSEEEDPDYRSAGLDVALHPAWHHRGLGADTLRTLARYLFNERGHHRLTIDPAAANQQAIASYQRVGFRPVGVMRSYERGSDGTWHDGLLMDMLRGELR